MELGDGFWDRYESTGDTIRIISKFGAFSVMPSLVVYSSGNSVVARSDAAGRDRGQTSYAGLIWNGDSGVRDYTLALKHENIDDRARRGPQLHQRLGGAAQDPFHGYLGPTQTTTSFNYDISNT